MSSTTPVTPAEVTRSASYMSSMAAGDATMVNMQKVSPAGFDVVRAMPATSETQFGFQVEGEGGTRRKSSIAANTGGMSLAYKGISYEVTVKKTKEKKMILTDVTGVAQCGTLNYIMGPSGAGKSTMLDAIAGRLAGDVQGDILVNGSKLKDWEFKSIAKYVQQEDTLVPVLTVKETLVYAAMFYTYDREDAEMRANDTIHVLGLDQQKDTAVGNVFLRGLSGGQKRRLSVGVELVARPQILLLDEPTSGLDSTAAASVVSTLKRIALEARTTILLTIHQPAEMLFRKADNLLLLSQGRVAFCGAVAESVEHMQALGHTVPPLTSSSEFLLDLVNADFSDSDTVGKILSAWPTSAAAQSLATRLDKSCSGGQDVQRGRSKYATSMVHQTWYLTKRGFLNTLRNPLVVWLRMALYVMLSLLIGTVWLRIAAGTPKADAVPDIAGVLFFIAAFMVFMSVAVLVAFLEEKQIFLKERANGTYSVAAYNIAHLIVDTPFMFLQALVCGTICYWLIGLNDAIDRYVFFILDLFLSFMVAESLMLLVSSIVPVAIVGIALGAMVYGGFMVVQGFFINLKEIGWWWRWMHYIGMHSYSFSAFMDNEFRGRIFDAAPDAAGGALPAITGEQVLAQYDFDDTKKWWNMVVLVAMALIYRLLTWWHMEKYHTGKH